MIKFLATDVDGTLVKCGSTDINPRYFDAINKLKEIGVTVAICSGRSEDSIRKAFSPAISGVYLVSNNGANVTLDGKEIQNMCITPQMVKQIAKDQLSLPHCSPLFATKNELFYLKNTEEACMELCHCYGFNMVYNNSLEFNTPINKVCVYNSLKGVHPGLIYADSYEGVTAFDAGDGWLDFVPKGVSKGIAIRNIQSEIGIKPQESICFGDQENDISMFEYCQYSVSVENSSEICYRASKYHTDSYEDLGVLKIMNRIIKGQDPFEE